MGLSDDETEYMEAESTAKFGKVRKIVDDDGRTVTIRPVAYVDGGQIKRIRRSDSDEEEGKPVGDEVDLVSLGLRKMQSQLAEMRQLAGTATVTELEEVIKKMHFEIESTI